MEEIVEESWKVTPKDPYRIYPMLAKISKRILWEIPKEKFGGMHGKIDDGISQNILE